MNWNFTRTQSFLILVLFATCLGIGIQYNVDLIVLYDTVRLVVQGQWEKIYSGPGENGSIGRYFYGPFSLLLFSPLGWLSYYGAKAVWLLFQSISYFLFWWLLGEFFPLRARKAFLLWLLVFIFAINPLHNNFQSNNIQLFLAVMLLGAEWLSRREGKWDGLAAGLLISVAAAVKIFPFFIFAFYWLWRPKLRKGLATGLVVTLVSPYVAFGPTKATLLYQTFLKNLTSYGQDNSFITVDDICCLPSLIARAFHYFGGTETEADPFIKLAILGISGAFLGFVWLGKKQSKGKEQNDILWTLAFALMAFLNPSTRPHYYIFYVPALAWLAKRWSDDKAGSWEKFSVLASVGLIALTQEGVTGKGINNLLEAWSIPTYGMLILCLIMTRQLVYLNRTARA